MDELTKAQPPLEQVTVDVGDERSAQIALVLGQVELLEAPLQLGERGLGLLVPRVEVGSSRVAVDVPGAQGLEGLPGIGGDTLNGIRPLERARPGLGRRGGAPPSGAIETGLVPERLANGGAQLAEGGSHGGGVHVREGAGDPGEPRQALQVEEVPVQGAHRNPHSASARSSTFTSRLQARGDASSSVFPVDELGRSIGNGLGASVELGEPSRLGVRIGFLVVQAFQEHVG